MGTEHYQSRTVRMTSFDTTTYQKHRRSLPTSKLRYVKFTPVYYLLIIITSLHRQLMLFTGYTILAPKYLATKSPSQGALKIVLEAISPIYTPTGPLSRIPKQRPKNCSAEKLLKYSILKPSTAHKVHTNLHFPNTSNT